MKLCKNLCVLLLVMLSSSAFMLGSFGKKSGVGMVKSSSGKKIKKSEQAGDGVILLEQQDNQVFEQPQVVVGDAAKDSLLSFSALQNAKINRSQQRAFLSDEQRRQKNLQNSKLLERAEAQHKIKDAREYEQKVIKDLYSQYVLNAEIKPIEQVLQRLKEQLSFLDPSLQDLSINNKLKAMQGKEPEEIIQELGKLSSKNKKVEGFLRQYESMMQELKSQVDIYPAKKIEMMQEYDKPTDSLVDKLQKIDTALQSKSLPIYERIILENLQNTVKNLRKKEIEQARLERDLENTSIVNQYDAKIGQDVFIEDIRPQIELIDQNLQSLLTQKPSLLSELSQDQIARLKSLTVKEGDQEIALVARMEEKPETQVQDLIDVLTQIRQKLENKLQKAQHSPVGSFVQGLQERDLQKVVDHIRPAAAQKTDEISKPVIWLVDKLYSKLWAPLPPAIKNDIAYGIAGCVVLLSATMIKIQQNINLTQAEKDQIKKEALKVALYDINEAVITGATGVNINILKKGDVSDIAMNIALNKAMRTLTPELQQSLVAQDNVANNLHAWQQRYDEQYGSPYIPPTRIVPTRATDVSLPRRTFPSAAKTRSTVINTQNSLNTFSSVGSDWSYDMFMS